jgi:hypothetical protein
VNSSEKNPEVEQLQDEHKANFSKNKNNIYIVEEIAYHDELVFKNGIELVFGGLGLLLRPFGSSRQF